MRVSDGWKTEWNLKGRVEGSGAERKREENVGGFPMEMVRVACCGKECVCFHLVLFLGISEFLSFIQSTCTASHLACTKSLAYRRVQKRCFLLYTGSIWDIDINGSETCTYRVRS